MRSSAENAADVETVMSEAFGRAGALKGETPQRAAERLWKETKNDPVEAMKRFERWARKDPERMLVVLGPLWERAVRTFMGRREENGGPSTGGAFTIKMKRLENKKGVAYYAPGGRDAWRAKYKSDPKFKEDILHRGQQYRDRKSAGIRRVRADIDVKTGTVLSIIDKEFSPFAHIRIDGLKLPEVTTQRALAFCDHRDVDNRFIRALCHQIPDPRKTIGEQWTAEIIREAKKAASMSRAA